MQHQLFAHVLGEPGHFHGPAGPGDVGIGGHLVGCHRDPVQGGHPVRQRVPQVGVVQRTQWRLALRETAGADGLACQVRAEYPGEFFGVSGLVNDDVAHRPRFTPGAAVGTALLHRIDKRLPLGKSFVVDVVHGSGYTRRL